MATKQDGTNRVMKLDAAGSGVIGIWDFEGSVRGSAGARLNTDGVF